MKEEYLNDCDISDQKKKVRDLIMYFPVFKNVMTNDLEEFRKSRNIFELSSRSAFKYYKNLLWSLAFISNFIMATS